MKLWDETFAAGELGSHFELEPGNVGSPEQNLQSATPQSPWEDASEFVNSLGDLGELEDFAAFTATSLDLSTQKQVSFSDLLADNAEFPNELTGYPAFDELTLPVQPYFGDSSTHQAGYFGMLHDNEAIQTPATGGNFPIDFDSFTDFLQGEKCAKQHDLRNESTNEVPSSQFKVGQGCHQWADSPSDFWSDLPALDELPSPDVSQYGFQPPPLPLHSKPSVGSNGRLQQKHFRHQAPAPVAMMLPRVSSVSQTEDSEWMPSNSPVGEDCEDLAFKPPQRGQKRKAPVIPLDHSDDEAPPVVGRKRERRVQECATKMAYVHGVVQQIPPGQRLNPRTKAIHQFDASKIYDQFTNHAKAWSIFEYTAIGELEPGRFYTPSEIHSYLYQNPLHTLPSGVYDPKNGGLRIWIQRNPADSARRYPSSLSNRCRFKDCFATNRVINQGHTRVCFDEQTHLRLKNDPFHAAGYVHLNCLERFLNFPAICRDLPISPENRNLLHEPRRRNRMMLAPDSAIHIAHVFIRACETGTLADYPEHGRPHRGTLVWQLMSHKVEEEDHVFRRQERKRGDAKASHVAVHLGDLELESKVRDKTRMARYQVNRKDEKKRVKKRKLDDESDSESGSESGSEKEVVRPKKRKYARRTKV